MKEVLDGISGYVPNTLFPANSVVKADVASVPEALVVAASRIIGRAAAGDITALTGAQVVALLDLSAYVTKALFDANTILAANDDDTPLALTIAASRIVGRAAAGNIAALTGAQIMALLTGQAGADFSMNTKKITGVVDPAAAQDVATKNYVDNAVPSLARVRGFRSATQSDLLHGKVCRVEAQDTTFDTDAGWETGTWQEGVGDAGSNATTIVDANPTTGIGFVASMAYALVIWDGGASSGYIATVDSGTQLTIEKNKGLDFGVGDTYTIEKAHYKVPTAGYWQIFGIVGWLWSGMIADKQINGGASVNGVQSITAVQQSAAVNLGLSNVFADMVHFDANDIVALTAQHYGGTDTMDVMGDANGRLSYIALSLLEPD